MPNELKLSEEEIILQHRIAELKKSSGSHSPSVSTLKQKLSEVQFKIDACFLSNPYATDLFASYFEKEILTKGQLRELLEFYPAQNTQIAKDLSAAINIAQKNLFIANGASEAIQAVMNNFSNGKVGIILPTFSAYYEFIKPGQEVGYYYLNKKNDFSFNTDDYLSFVQKENISTAIIINPNNPNGSHIPKQEMELVLSSLKNLESIIVDESFIHFAFENEDYEHVSIAELVEHYPNLVIIKSMSKDFGIAGIRAGYAVMNENRVQNLLERGYLWNSNGLAEYFFKLYTNPKFLKEYEPVRKQHIRETQQFIEDLRAIPHFKTYPSYGNFVLIELPETHKANDLTVAMLNRYGIYVRNCSDKKGLEGNFVRIASRTRQENDLIVKSLHEIFLV